MAESETGRSIYESWIRRRKDWKFPSLVGYYKDPGPAERFLFWNPSILTLWELFFPDIQLSTYFFQISNYQKYLSQPLQTSFVPKKSSPCSFVSLSTHSTHWLIWAGPGSLSHNALSSQVGWTVKDLDLIEANEAFAAQALAVNKVPVVRSDDDSVATVKRFFPRKKLTRKGFQIYVRIESGISTPKKLSYDMGNGIESHQF